MVCQCVCVVVWYFGTLARFLLLCLWHWWNPCGCVFVACSWAIVSVRKFLMCSAFFFLRSSSSTLLELLLFLASLLTSLLLPGIAFPMWGDLVVLRTLQVPQCVLHSFQLDVCWLLLALALQSSGLVLCVSSVGAFQWFCRVHVLLVDWCFLIVVFACLVCCRPWSCCRLVCCHACFLRYCCGVVFAEADLVVITFVGDTSFLWRHRLSSRNLVLLWTIHWQLSSNGKTVIFMDKDACCAILCHVDAWFTFESCHVEVL